MTDESQSASDRPVARRTYSKPTLVTIGNRQVTSSGRWNNACMAQYLMLEENRLRWVGIGELAKTAWGQNTLSTKDKARRYVFRLFNYLLVEEGRLLVVKFAEEGHHRIKEVKLYDPGSQDDRLKMQARLDRMVKTKDISERRYRQAIEILCPVPLPPPDEAAAQA